jgi:hypothetical protein
VVAQLLARQHLQVDRGGLTEVQVGIASATNPPGDEATRRKCLEMV